MEIDKVRDIGTGALKRAYLTQKELSNTGEISEFCLKGNGKDKSLRGDWESEEAVINYLSQERFPCRIIAEEHGQIDIVSNPRYLAILDGFDGSGALRMNPRARGGTMLAIADNLNPRYSDFVFGGLTEFCQDQILYATQNRGTFLIQNVRGKETTTKIEQTEREQVRVNTKIHLDDPFIYEHAEGVTSGLDEIGKLMQEIFTQPLQKAGFRNLSGLNSSASMCLDLVLGKVDAVCGVIAKGVFEPPAEQVLLKEIGGYLGDINGWDISDKKWAEFGRPLSPLIRVANSEIGKGLVRQLKR